MMIRKENMMTQVDNELGQAVKVYKALGEPTRLKIALMLVKESNQCVTAIGERLETVAASTLSHHLKQLTDSGLIQSRKSGPFISLQC
jgi:DNA-binding transcriptional ArsR family regulator